MYYTVTTELNNYTWFRGIAIDVELFVKQHFPTAEHVITYEGVITYEYLGGMNDVVKLVFKPHSSNIRTTVLIDGDAKYIL